MGNPLKICDLMLRDGHQSLLATRMRTDDMLPIAEKIDQVGYWAVEMWGGATFDSAMRFLDENPWDRIRRLKAAFVGEELVYDNAGHGLPVQHQRHPSNWSRAVRRVHALQIVGNIPLPSSRSIPHGTIQNRRSVNKYIRRPRTYLRKQAHAFVLTQVQGKFFHADQRFEYLVQHGKHIRRGGSAHKATRRNRFT